MHRAFWATLIVIAAIVVVAASSTLRRPHEVIPWRSDLASATTESRQTGKPILLDFSATWCGPCQEMRRTTWSDTRVEETLRGYIPVQIDLDANHDLAERFGVAAIPHLAVVDAQGSIVKSEEGMLSADDLIEWLAQKQSTSRP
jgi:thiol:disulfide interchange protein